MDIYTLSRNFFNWSFENPEKINPNHIALYFFCIEQCNRLGWKDKFGLPATMAKEAIGIRSYNTYKKTLDDLVEFGFIKMIEVSKNQYSSNIIAISKFNKAHNKALDKALIKHTSKQSESTRQSIDSIDIQEYNSTIIQDTNTQSKIDFDVFWNLYDKKEQKDSCLNKWNKLDFETQTKIIEILPSFIAWKSDKKYRPNPQTFLNQKRWLDEIPTQTITPKYISQIPAEENEWHSNRK